MFGALSASFPPILITFLDIHNYLCAVPGAVPVSRVLPAAAWHLGFGPARKAAADEAGGGLQ